MFRHLIREDRELSAVLKHIVMQSYIFDFKYRECRELISKLQRRTMNNNLTVNKLL